MFIYVKFCDHSSDLPNAGLAGSVRNVTASRRGKSPHVEVEEKTLMVNPNCNVGTFLGYIARKSFMPRDEIFDLCDASGNLCRLYKYESFEYAIEQFIHKQTYYMYGVCLIANKKDMTLEVTPIVNPQTKFFNELKSRITERLQVDKASIITILNQR